MESNQPSVVEICWKYVEEFVADLRKVGGRGGVGSQQGVQTMCLWCARLYWIPQGVA